MTYYVEIQREEAALIIKMRRPDKKNALTQERMQSREVLEAFKGSLGRKAG